MSFGEHLITVNALTIVVAFLLVLYAYVKRKINTSALIGTLTLGAVLLVAFGLEFGYAGLLVLLAFFIFGNVVTKYKYEQKAMLGVAEGNKGMRDINNVLGNGLSPLIFAVVYAFSRDTIFLLGFSGAVATACSDTFSTEIGQATGNPRLITTLKKVPVGTNGGVSLTGLGAALLGSALIALVSLAFIVPNLHFGAQWHPKASFFLVCLAAGFFGCLVDSLFGATLEDTCFYTFRLNKHGVNIIATFFGGIFAILLGSFLT
jgi:uncharacterized protein (TIGR00297 family)